MELLKWNIGNAEIILNSLNGQIEGFCWKGEQLVFQAAQLFTVGLRDHDGNLKELSSAEMGQIRTECQDDCWQLCFEDSMLEAKVTIRPWQKDGFAFRTGIRLKNDAWVLEWIDSPQIIIKSDWRGCGGNGMIFSPINEGMIIDEPRIREERINRWFAYKRMGFPNRGNSGYYPGSAQMQYLAYYNDHAGLYFGAHDETHTTKGVDFESLDAETVRFSLQTFCGTEDPQTYIQPFDIVLTGFQGDWMNAAEIYRNWAVSDPHLPKRLKDNPRIPGWFADSPITLIYAVRGDGDDKGDLSPNEYFPYVNALPAIEHCAAEFDSRIMALLMHWEGTAPWAPPYVWAPFGGEDALADFRDKLHAGGNLLGVYCSGTAWTQTSSIIDYSREEQCERENLREQMSRGPKGEINAFICNGPKGVGQRLGFDCCIGQPWTQETVCNEVLKLADFGVDYAQYFDQNLGGAAHFCYSKHHEHPQMPGRWQTEAMLQLVERIDTELQKRNSKMLIGCEEAAAQPYLKYMNFSDLRYANNFWFAAMPVPAYAFVFHEYVNNFMGNQNAFNRMIDLEQTPENLLFRTAYSFIAGDMLSVVLKDHGDIHWCWVMKWDRPAPEQKTVRTLIRNLNQWRRKAGKEFLVYGKMESPFCKVQAPDYCLSSLIIDRPLRTSSVLDSSWSSDKGRKAQFLVNFMPYEQKVTLSLPENSRVTVMDADENIIQEIDTDQMILIPPLQAVMLLVSGK